MKREKASYYLPPALVRQIRMIAAQQGESRSDVVQRIIEATIKDKPRPKPKRPAALPA